MVHLLLLEHKCTVLPIRYSKAYCHFWQFKKASYALSMLEMWDLNICEVHW